jgi:hypothetical protein
MCVLEGGAKHTKIGEHEGKAEAQHAFGFSHSAASFISLLFLLSSLFPFSFSVFIDKFLTRRLACKRNKKKLIAGREEARVAHNTHDTSLLPAKWIPRT